jgi:DMSO/TMAO reductase YedYZ molybdopterin-dependent catalytic subunit
MTATTRIARTARTHGPTVAVAVLAGVAAIATSFATTGGSQSFVVIPVEGLLTQLVPGDVIAWMIATFGGLGAKFNFLTATLLAVGLFGAVAGLTIVGTRAAGIDALATPVTLFGGWGAAAVLTGDLLGAFGAGMGAGLVVGTTQLLSRTRTTRTVGTNPDRRALVGGGAVALGLGAVGAGTELFSTPEQNDSGADTEDNPVDAATLNGASASGGDGQSATGDGQSLDADTELPVSEYKRYAREQSLDVDGLEPLLSEQFYNVDISSFNPDLDQSDWSVSVTGAVENEFVLTYEDLREYRAQNRMATLRCVGDSLNGYKIDNAVWTGVPMAPILEEASPTSDSCCVMLRAEDEYYNEFPIEALRDGFLAFGMNGQALPRAHGHPVRALIPGHWGEINVKWLSEIEILETEAQGYWEKKGWHGTGPVNTVAKLWDDGIVRHDDGRMTLAGHAYAGTRGIDRVEVSTDGGDTWSDAELIHPIPPEVRERRSVVDVWQQWHYEFEPDGTHEVVVRATDGEGNLQERDQANAYPRGATGWVSKTVSG